MPLLWPVAIQHRRESPPGLSPTPLFLGILPLHLLTFSTMFFPFITARKTRHALSNRIVSRPPNPDDIATIVLKICAPELALTLPRLFLSTFAFPRPWKNAVIFPHPNYKDASGFHNCRSVTLACLISKFSDQLHPFPESKVCIRDWQCGSRWRCPTGHLLAVISHSLTGASNKDEKFICSRWTSLKPSIESDAKICYRNDLRLVSNGPSYRG